MTPLIKRFINDAGNVTHSFGIGRGIGQIYAFLYFSPEPKNLSQMQDALGISKGAASAGVRQLEQWGAVHKVWVKGDRKDYYAADDWLGKILKNVIMDVVGRKMTAYERLLEGLDDENHGVSDEEENAEFIKERIAHLKKFQTKAQGFWTSRWLKMFLK